MGRPTDRRARVPTAARLDSELTQRSRRGPFGTRATHAGAVTQPATPHRTTPTSTPSATTSSATTSSATTSSAPGAVARRVGPVAPRRADGSALRALVVDDEPQLADVV